MFLFNKTLLYFNNNRKGGDYLLPKTTEDILMEIETTKTKMINSGIRNGLNNPKTLRISQKLDQLLNVYQQL